MELVIKPPVPSTEPLYNLSKIDTIDQISYDDFFKTYMILNCPCVIKGVSTNWEAAKLWTIDNKPNFDYLRNKYGDCDVTIYKCNEKYYNSQKTFQSKFASYVDYWVKLKGGDDLNYLKDWHLKLQCPNDNFYQVPKYFASDWLNEYLLDCDKDDYRFVYMGPKKTWTPFHADVFNSYSWSVNVCGKKKWLFFAPGQENNMRDSLNNLPYDVTDCDSNKMGDSIEITQNAGDAVFVPSGWHHQVFNLEDTISVNHNWFNGCNILLIWKAIENNLDAVEKEIEDCKDMDNFHEHCQLMLNSSFGLNYFSLFDLLKHIALKRLRALQSGEKDVLFNGFILSNSHKIFDLQSLKIVLQKFCNSQDVQQLSQFNNMADTPENVLNKIETYLSHYQ